jgi:hypothetical protein
MDMNNNTMTTPKVLNSFGFNKESKQKITMGAPFEPPSKKYYE